MASVVDICNLALSHLGDKAAVSAVFPPDSSRQAQHCNKFYPIARDHLLSVIQPQWAKTSVGPLSAYGTAPTEWIYQFSYPTKCIVPVTVTQEGFTTPEAFEIGVASDTDDTRVILTNVSNPMLKMVRKVEDTTKFDPLFVNALSFLLAAYLAGPISRGNKSAQRDAWQAYRDVLAESRTVDGQSLSPQTDNPGDFTPSHLASR